MYVKFYAECPYKESLQPYSERPYTHADGAPGAQMHGVHIFGLLLSINPLYWLRILQTSFSIFLSALLGSCKGVRFELRLLMNFAPITRTANGQNRKTEATRRMDTMPHQYKLFSRLFMHFFYNILQFFSQKLQFS